MRESRDAEAVLVYDATKRAGAPLTTAPGRSIQSIIAHPACAQPRTGNASEDDAIQQGVSAKAVVAVDACGAGTDASDQKRIFQS